ncbi:hypothetical protein D920_02240 [Enterococcus faecalis 13-SD-W-01]|nr:hypothetical protein D920_02240 [Enterococcus faecalis 13-SD-W-01]
MYTVQTTIAGDQIVKIDRCFDERASLKNTKTEVIVFDFPDLILEAV